jgi:hypothetical protein
MTEPLRVGLIGAGMVGRHHLLAWAAAPDRAKVVAVADPSHDNACNYTIAHFVTSLRDGTPFETSPEDNLRTLQPVEDCDGLSSWEASR